MLFRPALIAVLIAGATWCAESDAVAISVTIQERHSPYGGILDPIFESPSSDTIVGYTRCGDSALWTGHYLAAESYRYKVTGDPGALANLRRALDGLRLLVDITGTDLLARCAVPVDSPYAAGIAREEQNNGVYTANRDLRQFYWIGNTSRDQYSGAMFGLSVAYDLVEDGGIRYDAAALITRILNFLNHFDWNVPMPGGRVSTTFAIRPDQQLAFLQIGRHVNSSRFSSKYKWSALFGSALVPAPIGVDVADPNGSYFKFNLDTINLFSLIRWEGSGSHRNTYKKAYDVLRRTTDGHQNAHFNMIDRALNGPDERRDAETIDLLKRWLARPRRDFGVDLHGQVRVCQGDRACDPIPVEQRVPADFLWQRSPFQLSGGGDGFIEGAGIDYILPYWMARYYELPGMD